MDNGNTEEGGPAQDMAESTPPPPPTPARAAREPRSDRIGPTRLSGTWTAAVVAIVLVVAMLIFILQNGRQVPISFVSVHGHLPLGVAMLFSAVIGALIVVGCGTARILQLRRVAKRRSRAVPGPAVAPVPAGPSVTPEAPPPS
ncbi:MAG: lipopolysaccharide assembly protein LapA domain-containing protein [Acidimicrobiales bacterium]|jgi:uncharacterized integral membrane protein